MDLLKLFKDFLENKYIDLTDAGCDGLYKFRFRNRIIILELSPGDPYYFRLIVYFEVKENLSNEKLLEFNKIYKSTKIVYAPTSDSIRYLLSLEQFAYSDRNIDMLFDRCLRLLDKASEEFVNLLENGD